VSADIEETGWVAQTTGHWTTFESQLSQPGVEAVPHPVAQEVESHYDEKDGYAGEEGYPPGVIDVVATVVDVDTP
jgi:hypothetical protein